MSDPQAVLLAALHHHQAGRLADALQVLGELPGADPLPDHPRFDLPKVEHRAAHPDEPTVVSAAVRD